MLHSDAGIPQRGEMHFELLMLEHGHPSESTSIKKRASRPSDKTKKLHGGGTAECHIKTSKRCGMITSVFMGVERKRGQQQEYQVLNETVGRFTDGCDDSESAKGERCRLGLFVCVLVCAYVFG